MTSDSYNFRHNPRDYDMYAVNESCAMTYNQYSLARTHAKASCHTNAISQENYRKLDLHEWRFIDGRIVYQCFYFQQVM